MKSSGMKRGLAVSAVAAMAITGVSITAPAFADSVQDQTPAGQVLLITPNPGAHSVSTANDGVDATVHLTARAGVSTKQVQFVYNDGTDHNIGSPVVANDKGFFELDWTPPPALNNTSVDVRADGLDGLGNSTTSSAAQTVTVDPGGKAVNVSSTPDSLGVYNPQGTTDWFGAVSGTTNDLAANPSVVVQALNGAAPTGEDQAGDASGASRTFSGVVNFKNYSWDTGANATNDGVIGAQDGSDDAKLVHLYKQTISTDSSAEAAKNPVDAGDTTSVTVKVVDQSGKPVAGAKVISEALSKFIDLTHFVNYPGATGTTDSQGEVTFDNIQGIDGQSLDYKFDIDVNNNGSYESNTDIRRTVSIETYSPQASAVAIDGSAKAAYDRDELTGNEFGATVTDQNGDPLDGQTVGYRWTTTGFGANATPVVGPNQTVTSNGQGEVTIPAPTGDGVSKLEVWINKDGNPGPGGDDIQATPLTVSIGQATVVWDDGGHVTVDQGTTHTFKGSLQLPDGTTLGNRTFTADFNSPGGGDAVMAAQGDQPAGTTRTGNGSAKVTTAADGTFGIAVTDQSTPADTPAGPPDVGDTLKAAAAGSDFGPATSLTVDFLDTAVKTIDVAGNHLLGQGTHTTEAIPGVPDEIGTITVENADGDPLVGQDVTISVDHGYLTKLDSSGDPVPASDPTEGGLVGAWKDAGQSITVKTDDNGQVKGLAAAIGHDDAFATQDEVDAGLTVTAGGVDAASDGDTSTAAPHEIDWRSDDALNPTDLTLELSVAGDQDPALTKLPDASLNVYGNQRRVNLLASATDQFGNRVSLDTSTSISGVGDWHFIDNETGRAGWLDTIGIDNYDDPGTQTVTSTIHGTGAATTWHNTGTASAPVWDDTATNQPDLTASTSVNWYTVDFDNSTFALTHNTKDTVKPGTTVTETYTATDQKGAPIDDLELAFLRSGPDNQQDGGANWSFDTGSDGSASYIFQGTKAGKAIITGVAADDNDNPIAASQINDTVTFKTPKAQPKKIHVKLTAKNAKNGNDKLTVRTSRKAKGARVRIYKVVKGHLKKIGTAKINAKGVARKTIKEHTKAQRKHKTTYVVKVARTAATKAATSNKKRIR